MIDKMMAAVGNDNKTEDSDKNGYRLQMGMAAIGLASLFASGMEAFFVYPPSETDLHDESSSRVDKEN